MPVLLRTNCSHTDSSCWWTSSFPLKHKIQNKHGFSLTRRFLSRNDSTEFYMMGCCGVATASCGLPPFCSLYGWAGGCSSLHSTILTWSGRGLLGPILPEGSYGNIIFTLIPSTPAKKRWPVMSHYQPIPKIPGPLKSDKLCGWRTGGRERGDPYMLHV